MKLAFFFEKFCEWRYFSVEKFGIFELLDALSALTAREETQNPPTPSFEDAAFAPPKYPGSDEEPRKTESPRKDALAGFYARHDAVAKKAKK